MDKIFSNLHDILLAKYNKPNEKYVLDKSKEMIQTVEKQFEVVVEQQKVKISVKRVAVGPLLIKNRELWLYQFYVEDDWKIYNVLIKSQFDECSLMPIFKSSKIVLRIDSGCLTGQLYYDETCDCRMQLKAAIEKILNSECGMIVHIPNQDGRGKGLAFKLSTLYLQNRLGLNTVEAASIIANDNKIDDRDYNAVIAILKFFSIDSKFKILLNTNNPDKINIFNVNGYEVETEKSIVKVNEITQKHLMAKKKYLNHKV